MPLAAQPTPRRRLTELVPRRARQVRDRRRVHHRSARRQTHRFDRQLAHLRLARPAVDLVLPGPQLAHLAADAANEALRSKRARQTTRTLRKSATPAGADRFANLDWEPGPGGVPLLTDALATLECQIVAEQPAGDHWIVVGRVDRYTPCPSTTRSCSSPAHSALCNREQRHAPAGRSSASPRQHVKARPSSGSCTSTYANTRLSAHREQTHEPAPPLPGRPATHRRPSAQSQHRRAPTRQLRQRAANQPPAYAPTRPNHRPDRTHCASKPCRCLAHNPQRQEPPRFDPQRPGHPSSQAKSRIPRPHSLNNRQPTYVADLVAAFDENEASRAGAAGRRQGCSLSSRASAPRTVGSSCAIPAAERQCRSHRRAYCPFVPSGTLGADARFVTAKGNCLAKPFGIACGMQGLTYCGGNYGSGRLATTDGSDGTAVYVRDDRFPA